MLTRRSLLFGGLAAPAILRAAASPARPQGRKAENVSGGDYWNTNELFIDWIDNAGPSVTGEFTDPVTGIVSLPAGKTWLAVLRETAAAGAISHVKLRPGTMRVWWSGTATTAAVRIDAPSWVKVTKAGPQSLEMVIPGEDAQLGGLILLRMDNADAVPITMVEPHAVHLDDLPLFNRGEVFDPRHLASYPPDIRCIRVPYPALAHIFNGLDKPLEKELTYTQLVKPVTNHFWRHRNYQTAAKLASRLGRNVALWINANTMMDAAGYAEIARVIAATGFAGRIALEAGLEFWNYAYPFVLQKARARELIGPGIQVVDNRGNPSREESHVDACCYAEKSMQLWEAFAKHFPQGRLIRVLTGQTAWFDIMSPMFAYRRAKGPRCGEIFDAHSLAGYAGWTDTEEMYKAGAQDFSLTQWDAEMGKRLTELTDMIDHYKKQADGSPWSKVQDYLMYEGWHHIAVYDTYNLGNASCAAGNGTLEFTASIAGRISTGEFIYNGTVGNWVDAAGSPWPNRGAFARVVDATHVTLHPTAGDAAANTRPMVLLNAVSNAPFTNRGRAKAIADSALAWIHSSHGVAWTDVWWQQMKVRFNGYCCIFQPKQGISTTDGLWSFYPGGTNLHDPPGRLLAWWRSVPGA